MNERTVDSPRANTTWRVE